MPVWRNLYFTPGFYLGYGTIGGNNTGTVAYRTLLNPIPEFQLTEGDSPTSYAGGYEIKISSNYFYVQLSPELTWFFSNRIGLNIQTGRLGINVIDSDWRNSSKQINFNPSFWKLGIILKL